MAAYICIGSESFTFNPHTLGGLVGKATDAAVCFQWLHLNGPDQQPYPSIFLGRTQVRPGRHVMCGKLQCYPDRQMAPSSLHPTPVPLKSILTINLSWAVNNSNTCLEFVRNTTFQVSCSCTSVYFQTCCPLVFEKKQLKELVRGSSAQEMFHRAVILYIIGDLNCSTKGNNTSLWGNSPSS